MKNITDPLFANVLKKEFIVEIKINNWKGIAILLVNLFFIGCLMFGGACDKNKSSGVTSRAYAGHDYERDTQILVSAYKDIAGTRLDDCQTCHTYGTVQTSSKTYDYNPCMFCHLIPYPDNGIITGAPTTYADTLNPYGLDYKTAGRDKAALRSIEDDDSDFDNYSNLVEIEALRYPGDNSSTPAQQTIPYLTYTLTELKAMENHSQFLLMNSHKQEFDDYAYYAGITVKELLETVGVDLTNVTSITFIAPDGYAKDFDLDNVSLQYPDGLYYPGLGTADFTDPDQGFVTYPDPAYIPSGLTNGSTIADQQWMMLAWWRDGADLDPGYLDASSGRLEGEGPFRLVVPQMTPGSPDRGSKYSPSGYSDGWDYDDTKDHNAGLCVRSVVAIRLNPMPSGYEEFDWKNGGWPMLDDKEIIIYGCGVPEN